MKHGLRLLAVVLPIWLSHAQPLSGPYTIGGATPDFATLQDAGNALKLRGVSGPTFFNIRPGTYSRNGGNNTVLVLDSIVAGLSPANRITFQPDAATGGTVDNVILQMNITNSSTADAVLVFVYLDYVTFHDLTFQEHDSSLHTFNFRFVQLQRNFHTGSPPVTGTVFDGCKFIGSNPSGTENGIELGQAVRDITVRGNTFRRLLRGISGISGTAISQGTMLVEENQFLTGWRSSSGSGNALGSSMEIFNQRLIVKRNIIDFNGSVNGGYRGISLFVQAGSQSVIVEQNSVKGSVSGAIIVQSIGGQSDSLVVANNMINTVAFPVWANESAYGMNISQNPGRAKILFNTVFLRGGGLLGLHVDAQNSTVLNNIVITKPTSGFNICYAQGSATSTNFQSDYNIIVMQLGVGSSGPLVSCPAGGFFNLGPYQTATGLDTNSISKDLDFVDSADVHISDCQAQDPDMKGIPVAGITVDIDDEIRSSTAPMIGADENSFSGFGMFADPFKAGLSGTAFSIAADNFDNLLFDGLAVPDYDNRQVLLYHNLPPRSFVQSGTLPTGFNPNVVKFFDLDLDNNLDLIVGGDTTALKVFWGDGFGNFPSDTTISTVNGSSGGRVRSIDVGRGGVFANSPTILISEDNGFLPNTSFLGYIDNRNGRHIRHITMGPDTIPGILLDFIVGDLDGNGDPELAALTTGSIPPPMYVFNDTTNPGGGFTSYGTSYRYQLGTGSSPGHASSIIMGNFDGDTDNDFITLSTFSSCVFIRNHGNFSFTSEPISVAGAQALVRMDYENDGDLDFVTLNERLEENGITVFLNDGTGTFTPKENCFFPFATGRPFGAVASDFDQDGKIDIAVVAAIATGIDSLFVLYNLGGGTTHTPGSSTTGVPTEFTLEQNYPNPFNPSTRIEYSLPSRSQVTVQVYNILGQHIASMVNEEQPGGVHSIVWNGRTDAGVQAGSGVYFYRVEVHSINAAASFARVRKMLLLK